MCRRTKWLKSFAKSFGLKPEVVEENYSKLTHRQKQMFCLMYLWRGDLTRIAECFGYTDFIIRKFWERVAMKLSRSANPN